MLIPHDRADLRLGWFRRRTGLPAIDLVLRVHQVSRSLAGLGCFVAGNDRWVVFPDVLAAGRAGRVVVGGVRSPPRPRPADAAGAGCLRPGAAACGSMARLSTDKAPKIARPRAPVLQGRRTGEDAKVCRGHETVALGGSTRVLCLAGRLGARTVCDGGETAPSARRAIRMPCRPSDPLRCGLGGSAAAPAYPSAAPASRSSPPASTAMIVAATKRAVYRSWLLDGDRTPIAASPSRCVCRSPGSWPLYPPASTC
jgi:hypothetical protein